MNPLLTNDIEFIKATLNLSQDVFDKLSEEETDLNLLIEIVASKNRLTLECFKSLSLLFATKLLIFKYTQNSNIPLDHKLYISNIIAKIFPILNKSNMSQSDRIIKGRLNRTANEDNAQYVLVASGLLNAQLTVNLADKKHIYFIENGLKSSSHRDLSYSVVDWIILLRKIRNDGWFDNVLSNKTELMKLPSSGVKEGV